MGIVAATSVLLSLQASSPVAAQVIPAPTSAPTNTGIDLIGQNLTEPLQNSTTANITQLATVLNPQPIQPAAFTPVSESASDNDDDSNDSNDDDHDSNNNDNDDNDDDDDDDDHDHDHDHVGSSAHASAGGGSVSVSVG